MSAPVGHSALEDTMSDAAQSPNDLDDVEGHRISGNDNETIVEDDQDVEGHRIAGNDNETIVEDAD